MMQETEVLEQRPCKGTKALRKRLIFDSSRDTHSREAQKDFNNIKWAPMQVGLGAG